MNPAGDEVAALRASLQAEKLVSQEHFDSYLHEQARTALLLDALRRLLTFNEELCADVNVSTHYPSADFARAVIGQTARVGRTVQRPDE